MAGTKAQQHLLAGICRRLKYTIFCGQHSAYVVTSYMGLHDKDLERKCLLPLAVY